jgi:propionate CoA-transferase
MEFCKDMDGIYTTAADAVEAIDSHDTVTISGLGNVLCPEHVLETVAERYSETGDPTDLTVFTPIRVGNEETGLEHLADDGLLSRLITGSFNTRTQPGISELTTENRVEAFAFPMGISFNLLSQIAAGRPGIVTDVGLGTYVDPRLQGARYNETTPDDLIEIIEVDGTEHMFYKTFPIDVAIIRGTTSDPKGNISLEYEPNRLGVLDMAMAARNSGGTVIVQVKRRTSCTHRDPGDVEIPGSLVDHVVVYDDQLQIQGETHRDPSLTGEIHDPSLETNAFEELPLRKRIILRRALREIQEGDLINLGVGMPVYLPQLCLREGPFDEVTFTTEHGIFGGVVNPDEFGTHRNPEAVLTSSEIFRLYQGGGLDVSFLGFAQMDERGNVNNSNFANLLRGPGGFIDITNRTDKLVFCGTLTAGGLQVDMAEGELIITEEGRHIKLVEEVEEITLNAEMVSRKGATIKLITARGVFEIAPESVTLTQVAPGIEVDRDIRSHAAFDIAISDDLSTYDPYVLGFDSRN